MNHASLLNVKRIGHAFSRHAHAYESRALAQQRMEDALLERVFDSGIQPERVVDLGCGPGRALKAFKKKWPKAQIIGVDASHVMLKQAARKQGWRRKFQLLCADANQLPIESHSIDLVFSSLCLQWLIPMDAALAQIHRILRPGGAAHLAVLGHGSLPELHEALHHAGMPERALPLPDIMDVGALLQQSGLMHPVLDRHIIHQNYADAHAYLEAIRGIGAGNAPRSSSNNVMRKNQRQQLLAHLNQHQQSHSDGTRGIRSRYDCIVVYAQAADHATQRAQAAQMNRDGVAFVDGSRIPRRQR